MNKTWVRVLGGAVSGLLLLSIIGEAVYQKSHRSFKPVTNQVTQQPSTPPNPILSERDLHHLTELAIVDDTQFFSSIGYPLYTVVMTGDGDVTEQRIADHATWAQFSPDATWIAVAEPDAPNSNGEQTTSLWLMKVDGSDKRNIPDINFGFGAWIPRTEEFVYGAHSGKSLHVVTPTGSPRPFPMRIPKNATFTDLRVSPDGQYVAGQVTLRSASGPYDQLILLNFATRKQRTLIQTKVPNGMFLGPWASDSRSVFWWPDPVHSASIGADGLTLTQTDLSGQTKTITTTLLDQGLQYPQLIHRTVVPYDAGSAALQIGGGREIFLNKTIGLWQDEHLQTLPSPSGKVQLSPNITKDGRLIAFVVAPALHQYWGSDANFDTWVSQFTMNLYNVETHQVTEVTAAGQGVQTPLFTADGHSVLYVKNNNVAEISVASPRSPRILASLPRGLLEIADYLP